LNPVPKNCRIRDENYIHRIASLWQQNDLASWHQACFITHQSIRIGSSEVNMTDGMQKDWRELCVAVTKESDSTKLTSLVEELIVALDRGERSWGYPIPPSELNRDESGSRLRVSLS
jgi:hypothetical protein